MSYALHYNRWMPEGDAEIRALARRKLSEYVDQLPEARDATIADMGSGPGLLALALSELGYRNVISFDADASQVSGADRLGVQVTHVPVDETDRFLSSLDGRIDLFLLIDVLEHVEPVAQIDMLRAIRRTLSPAGRLLCQVPNADSPVAMRYRYSDPTHRSSFTVESLSSVLNMAGFRVHAIREAPRHHLSGYGRGLRAVAWFVMASAVRTSTRLRMLPYVGKELAFSVPMSANMLAIAS